MFGLNEQTDGQDDKLVNSETGHVCGESHPRAKLTDDEVRQMRADHELCGMSVRAVSNKWGVAFYTVRRILRYQRRAVRPDLIKRVPREDP